MATFRGYSRWYPRGGVGSSGDFFHLLQYTYALSFRIDSFLSRESSNLRQGLVEDFVWRRAYLSTYSGHLIDVVM